MKKERLAKISEIISRQIITTQEELADALKNEGFDVTQATVSRDIKELGLTKIPAAGGEVYRYSMPFRDGISNGGERIRRLLADAVMSLDFSENLVVIKALPGTAQGIAAVIDRASWPEILGTVAGDDTILVVVKPIEKVPEVMNRFRSFLK